MLTKLSEKKFAFALICLVCGIMIFVNTSLVATPVRVSEKAIVFMVAAIGLVIYSMSLFRGSIVKK